MKRGRAGAEPRGSGELLAGQARSSQEPTCHPGEGRCRQHSPLEAHRPRRACLSPRCEVCEGWQTEQKPLQDLSHFSIFFFFFSRICKMNVSSHLQVTLQLRSMRPICVPQSCRAKSSNWKLPTRYFCVYSRLTRHRIIPWLLDLHGLSRREGHLPS